MRKVDLELLSGEFAFGLNRIYLSFNDYSFRPSFLVAINQLVLEQFSTDLANLDLPKILNWNSRKYFPSTDENTMFLSLSLGIRDRFSYDLLKPISSGGTVTFVAMQLAYWMGFSEVVLLGVDHNFVDQGVPNQTEIRKSEIDPNHFAPDYFPKGTKWQLPDLFRSEIAYRLAKEAFEEDGRVILDATENGKLDIFPKVSLEEVLGYE